VGGIPTASAKIPLEAMNQIENGMDGAIDTARIEKAVREIIEALGEDPDREGLAETPERVAAFYAEVFDGLHRDPGEVVDAFFGEEHYQEIVMVR
jgi:GTP cyclohydrolase I